MSRIPSGAAPLFVDRSFRIVAHLHPSESVPEGVVVSLGDLSGGFTLFVRDRRLVFEYNCEGTPCRVESAASAVDARSHTLELAFTRTQNLAGEATLLVDGRPVGCGEIPRTAKWFISWSALDVGRDSLSRVSDVYADAFPFTPGALARVDFELEPVTQPVDHAPID
jgi:arylsulfatase